MTAARSDLMALADAVMCDLFPKGSTLDRSITADRAWEDLRTDIRKSLELRLAASQPDREAQIEAALQAALPIVKMMALTNDDPHYVVVGTAVEDAIDLLSGAGTKSDGGQETDEAREARTALPDQRMPTPSSGTVRETPMNDRDRLAPSDPSPGPDVRRRVLDILNVVAPAVENLARHQGQCDMDGVMVKVSRQALDEVLNAVNEVALVSALTRPLGGNIK